MTDHAPTITIAGLRAQVDSLETSLRAALDDGATSEEVRLIREAERAAVAAERDALAAQLAEVRAELQTARVQVDCYDSTLTGVRNALRDAGVPDVAPHPADDTLSDHERSLRAGGRALQPVERIRMLAADLASERAHLAACKERIAGLERAADERSGEVARLTARVAELEARPVLTEERLAEAMSMGKGAAAHVMAKLGPVTLPLPLPAQDRAEELALAVSAVTAQGVGAGDPVSVMTDIMRRALASLGAPATAATAATTATPRDAVRGAMELAAESFGGSDGTFTGAGFSAAIMSAAGLSGAADGRLVRAILRGRSDVRDCGGGHYRIVRTTTPTPAPADVFAGVSEDELIRLFYVVGTDGIDHGEQCPPIDASDRNGIRAVLARLDVSLVAPVDPEQLAADITAPIGDVVRTGEWKRIKEAARAALLVRGIPVTPERGK